VRPARRSPPRLRAAHARSSLPPATLHAYRARVEALQASLRPVPRPAYVRPPLARVTLAPPPPPPPGALPALR